jgi:hypothetical protein
MVQIHARYAHAAQIGPKWARPPSFFEYLSCTNYRVRERMDRALYLRGINDGRQGVLGRVLDDPRHDLRQRHQSLTSVTR